MTAIIAWIMSHQAVEGALVIGILDFAMALVPSWKSNGIIHWVYVQALALVGK